MNLEQHNKFIHELLSDPDRAEALIWLNGATDESDRTVGVLESNEESIGLINEAYKAGAIKVYAVEIDVYPDGQNTGKLVVEVPESGALRGAVFEWCGERARALGYDPDEDIGQSHLFVMLD